jgi:hypothetical protein
MSQTVVLVGHCGPDSFLLENTARKALPDAEIIKLNDESKLRAGLPTWSVLLVNRVLDGAFKSDSGIALIEALAGESEAPPMLLVSNFAESQAEAEQVGAKPGFGKNDLYVEETLERIRAVAR